MKSLSSHDVLCYSLSQTCQVKNSSIGSRKEATWPSKVGVGFGSLRTALDWDRSFTSTWIQSDGMTGPNAGCCVPDIFANFGYGD